MEEQQTAADVQAADGADIEKNKLMAILAYILFFIPLLAAKDSKFAMYHANQGLMLFIVGICSQFVLNFIPFIGGLLGMLMSLVVLAFMVIGIINAANGQMKPLPVIGGVTLLK